MLPIQPSTGTSIDHSRILERYRPLREVRFRLNNLIVKTIPRTLMEECGRLLGFFRKGTFVFDCEDESGILMDYCLYYPGRDGRSLVEQYLETMQPPEGSDERTVLQAMTLASYSLFRVTGVVRGVGVQAEDLLKGGSHFIADIGFGTTAWKNAMLATRTIPQDDFLVTGGAALPVDLRAGERILQDLKRTRFNPATFDFHRITPQEEAEFAARIIRTCLASGMSSHVAYAEPGARPEPAPLESKSRRIGRNDPCPCGSGTKFKKCCGRHLA